MENKYRINNFILELFSPMLHIVVLFLTKKILSAKLFTLFIILKEVC